MMSVTPSADYGAILDEMTTSAIHDPEYAALALATATLMAHVPAARPGAEGGVSAEEAYRRVVDLVVSEGWTIWTV